MNLISLLASNLKFEPIKFVESLKYMGQGLLVIFIVIGLIVLLTVAINKIFTKTSKKAKANEDKTE